MFKVVRKVWSLLIASNTAASIERGIVPYSLSMKTCKVYTVNVAARAKRTLDMNWRDTK